MANNYLIVVDMQHDFVSGSLGTPEARAIVGAVADRASTFDGTVVFTRDTHDESYLETQEGRNLPVAHCIRDTPGWELVPELERVRANRACAVFDKPSFGSLDLASMGSSSNTTPSPSTPSSSWVCAPTSAWRATPCSSRRTYPRSPCP